MKITLILSVVLTSITLGIGDATNTVDLNRVFQHVFDSTKVLDVQLIIQDFRGNADPIVREIHKISSGALLTTCISFTDSIPENLSLFPLSTGTLMVYLFISKYPPSPRQTNNIAEVIRHEHNRPKVLFVTILDGSNNDFRSFFKTMWSQRIIHVSVMELSVLNEKVMGMTVHRYNPFNDDYINGPYSSELQWFPNDVMNLHGYPIVVSSYQRIGYVEEVRDSKGDLVEFIGPDAECCRTLQRMMNFTVVPYIVEPSARDGKQKLQVETIHRKLQLGEIEMLMTTIPYTVTAGLFSANHTQPFTFENWCPVIPRAYRHANLNFDKFRFLFLSVVAVVVFCLLSIFLKFESNFWKPTNLFGSIFSICIRGNLARGIERAAFVCVFLVSCFCSSQFYADLTSISIGLNLEVDYETFRELGESGLTPVFDQHLFNNTFAYAEGDFRKLKEKALTFEDTENCLNYLLQHKNVSCFLNENMVKAFVRRHVGRGKSQLKICKKLCYWTPLVGYSFYRNLPYVARIDNILRRLESSGIRSKWYSDYLYNHKGSRKFARTVREVEVDESLHVKLRYVALCGYFISIIVFLIELAMNRIYNV